MGVFFKRFLRAGLVTACCALPFNAWAVDYPSGFPPATVPYTMGNTETLNVTSGTMATAADNVTGYTIRLPTSPLINEDQAINISAGATVSYLGDNSVGSIYQSRNDAITGTDATITNSGTISSGTGTIAINLTNGIGATAANTATITLNTGSSVIGSIVTNGLSAVTLNVNGTATVSSAIALTPKSGGAGTSTVAFGASSGATFSTQGSLQDITAMTLLTNASTVNLNNAATGMGTLSIGSTSTMSFNSSWSGTGTIANAGTWNISANVTSGAISGAGTNNIRQAVTITAASYANTGTHNSILTDVNNYGNATITGTANISNFDMQYEDGYFPAGTYTLLSSSTTTVTAFASPPSATLFLTFGTPVQVGQTVRTTITRNLFQSFATNTQTYSVGAALEYLGTHSPSASTVTLLNAVEASTTAGQVQSALSQLSPLVTAPLQAIEVQDQSLKQVQFRLATIRPSSYNSGSYDNENAFWIRGLGNKANQQAIDDIQGYYATSGGFALGFDRSLDERFLMGLAGSYTVSHVRDKVNAQSNTLIKSYQAILYGTYNYSNARYLDWAIGVAANNYTSTRYVNIDTLNLVANGEYFNQQYAIKGTWGEDFAFADFLQLTPEGSMQYTFAKQYPYTETGGGAANLTINRANSSNLQLGLGGKIATPVKLSKSIFAPELHGMVLYNIINGNQDTISNFAAGGTIIASNLNMPRTSLRLGAAVSFIATDHLELKLNYDYVVMDNYTDNSLYLNLKYIL